MRSRTLETNNLLVPLVGNFSGDKTLRTVGRYLKERRLTITAFYTSNVEQYLFQQGDDWQRFYANVATLPLDSTSTFIRSLSNGGGFRTGSPELPLGTAALVRSGNAQGGAGRSCSDLLRYDPAREVAARGNVRFTQRLTCDAQRESM